MQSERIAAAEFSRFEKLRMTNNGNYAKMEEVM